MARVGDTAAVLPAATPAPEVPLALDSAPAPPLDLMAEAQALLELAALGLVLLCLLVQWVIAL